MSILLLKSKSFFKKYKILKSAFEAFLSKADFLFNSPSNQSSALPAAAHGVFLRERFWLSSFFDQTKSFSTRIFLSVLTYYLKHIFQKKN
ncbi:MAG: hypothetical protein ACI9XO_004228 [Paraglaciecola sp.]|jgi:hypothetical protein